MSDGGIELLNEADQSPTDRLRIFLSYAVRDTELVESLERDLEALGHIVWRDVDIAGGRDWWDDICNELRSCDAVVFAVSPASLRSRYCEAELGYALALDRPLLPVMVRDTPLTAASVHVQVTNSIRYEGRPREAIFKLAKAIRALSAGVALPTQLPPQPVSPMGDLPVLRTRIRSTEPLDETEQLGIVDALKRLLDGAEDLALELVRLMRSRVGLFESVARGLDDLLESTHDWAAYGSEARPLIQALATQAARGALTPILGTGMTDSLVGSRRLMARSFADEFDFPLAPHLRDDLPQVTQFVRVKSGEFVLRDLLRSHMDKRLRATLADTTIESAFSLDELFAQAWDTRDRSRPDPHELLASMPCPIYVTAHPARLLEHALRAEGKDPVTEVCHWKLHDNPEDWPPSEFRPDADEVYRPSVQRPLVFHVFGLLDWPETLVLTEDDYFRFLIGVTSQRDKRVPAVVRSALADSALLVLGFRVDDWDFRTLWQALMSQEGNSRLRKYKHVAAQVDPAGSVVSAAAAREFLRDYFDAGTPKLDLFWGSVAEFAAAVHGERSRRR